MQKIVLVLLSGLLILSACNKVPGTGEATLNNEVDSVSYALGAVLAKGYMRQLEQQKGIFDTINYRMIARAYSDANIQDDYLDYIKKQLDSINGDLLKKGFLNQLTYGHNGVFSDNIVDGYLQTKSMEVRKRNEEERKAEAGTNKELGKKFLEENRSKEGVVETESGLQYKILKEGTGKQPTASSNVKCTYQGTLLDGTVFESSIERGDTASFNVGGVIKGWQEALPMMKEGSKWRLFIPSDLAYGDAGSGKIEPGSTLIFDIELISVN